MKSMENRDKADEKIMATSPGNQPGRDMPVSMDTLNNGSVNANANIESYYAFPSSKVVAVETYSKRLGTLEEKLGNKDSVKG